MGTAFVIFFSWTLPWSDCFFWFRSSYGNLLWLHKSGIKNLQHLQVCTVCMQIETWWNKTTQILEPSVNRGINHILRGLPGAVVLTINKSRLLFFKLKADHLILSLQTELLPIIKYLALTHKCQSLENQLIDAPSRTHRRFCCWGFLLTPANIKICGDHLFGAVAFLDT